MAPIVTFDVWDTLLRRKCHPDEIKVFSWERFQIVEGKECAIKSPSQLLRERQMRELEIAQLSLDIGFDDEYLIDDVFWSSDKSKTKEQVNFEIRLEIANTFKSQKISRHLKGLNPEQIMLISDFYMSSNQLRMILETKYPDLKEVPLYTSADVGLNKRSGRLFGHLQIAKPWVHIGDNPKSDFLQSKRHGATPVLFRPRVEEFSRWRRERRFRARFYKRKLSTSNIDVNLKIAIGLVGFSAWLNYESKGRILFLEREGIFLKKVYEIFCRNNPWDFVCKPSGIASVSRLSTVSAAFHKEPLRVLERLIIQYPDLTIHGLEVTLRLPLGFFPKELEKASGLQLVSEIVNNFELMEQLKAATQNSFETASGYLRTLGLSSELTVVDLGWSGTIQDNIRDLLGKDHKVAGRYFAMRPPSASHPEKLGFLNFCNQEKKFLKILRALRPVEMLFNSKIGSTTSYSSIETNFVPQRSPVLDSYPLSFEKRQQEIIDSVTTACDFIRDNLLTVSECANLGAEGLASFISKPRPEIISAYLDSIHDESYGLGVSVNPGDAKLTFKHLIQILRRDSSEIRRIYWKVGWPEALAKSTLNFIPPSVFMKFASWLIWRVR